MEYIRQTIRIINIHCIMLLIILFFPNIRIWGFLLNSRAIFYLSSHAMINKSILLQLLHIVNVPAIQDQRGCHQFFDGRPGRHPEFFPFRDEQEGIPPRGCSLGRYGYKHRGLAGIHNLFPPSGSAAGQFECKLRIYDDLTPYLRNGFVDFSAFLDRLALGGLHPNNSAIPRIL